MAVPPTDPPPRESSSSDPSPSEGASTGAYPYFVKRDLDGFFGLFIDNLVQFLLIVEFCAYCGIGPDSPLLLGAILPGAAVSLLLGNLFYAWQARRLAIRTGRDDVTALPYGINTPSLLVFLFFVMIPAYQRAMADGSSAEDAATLAWTMGLVACLGSGVIEFLGAFVAGSIRRHTPRAALLSTLAGIAIGFIAMTFALQIFARPLVAMAPMAVVLITYFSGVAFPSLAELPGLRGLAQQGNSFVRGLATISLPGGLVAVGLGTAIAWTLPFWLDESIAGPAMQPGKVAEATGWIGFYVPRFASPLFEALRDPSVWVGYLSVIVPMGLFNVIGSLQNIESAEAAGDAYDTRSSLAVNGLGTIAAACFGSCFPTTIYIGHPGWKGLGARAGYSTLNGIIVTLVCLTGTVGVISRVIPIEAGIAIVLWIGIIITAQAFQTTPREHAPAVATGLFPAIAAWGMTVAVGGFVSIGVLVDLSRKGFTEVATAEDFSEHGQEVLTVQSFLDRDETTKVNGFLLHGLIVMERGYIFTCMILAAISAFLVDRRFYTAALWAVAAAGLSAIGLMHAYQVVGNDVDYLFLAQPPREGALVFRAYGIALGYLLFAGVFAAFGRFAAQRRAAEPAVAEA